MSVLKNKAKVIAVLCSIVLGAVIGMLIFPAAITPALGGISNENIEDFIVERTEWSVNENGYTYGSLADARSYEDAPDLVRVRNPEGIEGYVFFSDLQGFTPNNPEEALAYMQSRERSPSRSIPIYDKYGLTIIGEFEIKSMMDSEMERLTAERAADEYR